MVFLPEKTGMILLSTLKSCVSSLGEITDATKQVVTGSGYNAIVELVMSRQTDFPCIVLEDQDGGVLSISPGGFDRYTQSIWVVERVGAGEDPEPHYNSTKALLKKVIAALSRNRRRHADLGAVDFTHMAYMKRDGGNEFAGWEIILTTEEDIDLS